MRGIPKLEDANDAGTPKSLECTSILTAGNSMRTLAIGGLKIIGRNKFGVLPLDDELLNISNATQKQIRSNGLLNKLIRAIGLQYNKNYLSSESLKTLQINMVHISKVIVWT